MQMRLFRLRFWEYDTETQTVKLLAFIHFRYDGCVYVILFPAWWTVFNFSFIFHVSLFVYVFYISRVRSNAKGRRKHHKGYILAAINIYSMRIVVSLARLGPSTVQLPNLEAGTSLLGA